MKIDEAPVIVPKKGANESLFKEDFKISKNKKISFPLIKLVADCLKFKMEDWPLITKMHEEYEFFKEMPHIDWVTLCDLKLTEDLAIPMSPLESTD